MFRLGAGLRLIYEQRLPDFRGFPQQIQQKVYSALGLLPALSPAA